MRKELAARLLHIRARRPQPEMAAVLGVSPRTYTYYEQGERAPDAEALANLCREGWNVNWFLTGEGPERVDQIASATEVASGSQGLSQESLKIALQMAADLDVLLLPPPKQARMIELIYGLLEEGLPEAKVLVFARAAAA